MIVARVIRGARIAAFRFFLSAVLASPIAVPAAQLGQAPIAFLLEDSSKIIGKNSLSVSPSSRVDVVAFYNTAYKASIGVPPNWNGSVSACLAGTTSQAYIDATLQRINYYRAMVGLPGDVISDPTWNAKAQQAALMMAAQNRLSHSPDPTWVCYTDAGKEAAGSSNLSLGADAANAIDLYIDDPGAGNTPVGHRRWILYPPLKVVGVGNIPAGSTWGANALWVIGGVAPRPTAPEFVAWPPPGFVPYQVMPKSSGRWSFSYPDAEFSSASVTMTASGTNVALSIENSWAGYGDNTIVWKPSNVSYAAPTAEISYTVTISNALINNTRRAFSYVVTVIDTGAPTLEITRDGTGMMFAWLKMDRPYALFASGSPAGPWERIQTPPDEADGRLVLTLPSTANTTARFFRLQQL